MSRGQTLPQAILSVSLAKRWLSSHTLSWALCRCQSCLSTAQQHQNPSSYSSVLMHGHCGRGACKIKAEYANAFLLIMMLWFRAGLPSFACEKSKYMASFALFWSLLLSSSELFKQNTFEHHKNIKRAYLLGVYIFMKSNYHRELKESRAET